MARSHSPSELTSPTPFSPFSAYSRSSSELATSDDAPDLGAFANVFAELDDLRVPGVLRVPRTAANGTPSSSILALPSDSDSARSSVSWRPPAGAGRGLPARVLHSDNEVVSPTTHAAPIPSSALPKTAFHRKSASPSTASWSRASVSERSLSIQTVTSDQPSDREATSPAVASSYQAAASTAVRNSLVDLHAFGSNLATSTATPRTSLHSDGESFSSRDYYPTPASYPPPAAHDITPLAHSFPHNDYDDALSEEDETTDVDIEVEIASDSGGRPPSDVVFEMDDDLELLKRATVASGELPTLGALDEALRYLAAERERVAALRTSSKPVGIAGQDADPRRKRRRKKLQANMLHPPSAEHGLADDSSSSVDISSSLDVSSSSANFIAPGLTSKSTPATPPRNRKERRRLLALQLQQQQASQASKPKPSLAHSRSSPNIRLTVAIPVDPLVLQIRTLATKLRLLFPEDASRLSHILSRLSRDWVEESDLIDPRGPAPTPKDPLIHVFIDHSNILIGLLNYVRRRMSQFGSPKRKQISHAALALVLERGRPIARRVLAASSPLYQPMDTAEQLGYEVRVYARVPDTGDGADRVRARGTPHKGSFSGGTSAESDGQPPGSSPSSSNIASLVSPSRPRRRHSKSKSFSGAHSHGVSAGNASVANSLNNTGTPVTATVGASPIKVKYREQGVDELLQLKVHQAIAATDEPPPGATIILATGDGNVGQFNEEGFLGCVRTALKKGWRVELYAWEDGLSRSWRREFSEPWIANGTLRIIGLEKYAGDLLDTHTPDRVRE